jgi:hypothetical protein
MAEASVRIENSPGATYRKDPDPMARLVEEFGPLPRIDEMAERFHVSVGFLLGLDSPGMWS